MQTSEPERRVLAVPAAHPAHFARNFIRLAVCELRFPTLLELEERTPVALSKALRHEYPTYEALRDVNVNPTGVAHSVAHAFRSKKGRWTVTLRPFALSLETSSYDGFDELVARLDLVVNAAKPTIDSGFFTRIGLRYINAVPFDRDIAEWVNPELTGLVASGLYGDVDEHWQRVRGPTSVGGYTFQHGVTLDSTGKAREYVLDFDFFQEDVQFADAVGVVRGLHTLEYSMFAWSLGPKALEHLGPSDLISRRS